LPWRASPNLLHHGGEFPHDFCRAGFGLTVQFVGKAGERQAARVIRTGIRHALV
jgi:hypothetical protein